MITVLLGTRAQMIKMAPVIVELEKRNWNPRLILTGQHKETMEQLLADFGISSTPTLLYDGPEVSSIKHVIPWFAKCLWHLWRNSKTLFDTGGNGGQRVILVHGDTFSTLLGALIGRLTGQQVAHVESGLRSFNVWHPFPEELTRLAVFRLAHIGFCPDDWALSNLKPYCIEGINTSGNTLFDALRLALAASKPLPLSPPKEAFGVVSLHRFENIFKQQRLLEIVKLIEEAASRYPLVFVLHPATRKNLEKFKLFDRLSNNKRISLWPRIGYFEFVTLLKLASFVITDGGSNQEELSYLGKPTLLMRRVTERQEGLGSNVVLCAYQREKFLEFLEHPHSAGCLLESPSALSPSLLIADKLECFSKRAPPPSYS